VSHLCRSCTSSILILYIILIVIFTLSLLSPRPCPCWLSKVANHQCTHRRPLSHVLRYSGDIGCPLNISKHEISHVKHPSPEAALLCLLLRFYTVSTSGVYAFLFVVVSSRLVTSHALLISKIGGCAILFLVAILCTFLLRHISISHSSLMCYYDLMNWVSTSIPLSCKDCRY
jgi:hypothetical protein